MEGSTVCPDDDAKMADAPEESSWTFYIEGFMRDDDYDDDNNNASFSSEFESPSLVSDAASSAVNKLTSYYNCACSTDECGAGVGFSSGKTNNINPRIMFKQNSFKKQKTKVLLPMDFDLEDTASSPVNSPKVSYMNQFMNQKEKAKMDVSDQVKRNLSYGKGGIFAVERDNNYTDLKKRT